MRIITVARKPLSEGTVAANVLTHGCGSLNIDATRIALPDQEGAGRWPANLILQHSDACVLTGVKTIKATAHYPASRPAGSNVAGAAGHVGQANLVETNERHEQVAAWECSDSCPVLAMDMSVGLLTNGSGGVKRASSKDQMGNRSSALGAESRPEGTVYAGYGDSGVASRYFKQFVAQKNPLG